MCVGQWEEQAREAAVASLFEEQQAPRGNALLGQLSFSQQKSFCWSSQVVKPEEGWGRGGQQAGAEEEEAGSGSSLLSIKHSPPAAAAAAAQMPPNRVGIPPPRLSLPASTWAERGKVVLLVGRRVEEQQVGGAGCCTHTLHHHQLLPGVPAAGD